VLEQVGSPDRHDDQEDQAADGHVPHGRATSSRRHAHSRRVAQEAGVTPVTDEPPALSRPDPPS
jgi:hypothetical protein